MLTNCQTLSECGIKCVDKSKCGGLNGAMVVVVPPGYAPLASECS